MKPVTTIALLLLLPFVGWTQQALRTSRTEGHFTRVYKLTDKETVQVIKENDE